LLLFGELTLEGNKLSCTSGNAISFLYRLRRERGIGGTLGGTPAPRFAPSVHALPTPEVPMKHVRATIPHAFLALALACLAMPALPQQYASSVVGTDFDFIVDEDPSTFLCLEFHGQRLREMPDKTADGALIHPALVFLAYYEDGTKVDIALDADFATESAAREEALRYATRLGKLPTSLRSGVERIVVHAGPTEATAFSDRGLIVLYSANATKRIATHDLEETLFHESVHAAWDGPHRESSEWLAAQAADGAFLTAYAAKNPGGEDLAESALFAYTLLHHPERIPADHAARIRAVIPARIAFVEKLVPPGKPIFHSVGPRYACDGSGTTFTIEGGEDTAAAEPAFVCSIDITTFGGLEDVLSNALVHGLGQEEPRVRTFLDGARARGLTAEELRDETAREFGFDRARVDAQISAFLHCNCDHGGRGVPAEAVEEPAMANMSASAPLRPVDVDLSELRWLLTVIAALVALLLVVSTATMVVVVKRSRALV